MQNAASQHEEVPDGMHIALFAADGIENDAQRIGDTARDKKHQARKGQRSHQGTEGEDDSPAHSQIAGNRYFAEFLKIDRV